MVVETSKEGISINKLVCEKEEILNVEDEMIVPDSKPDILSVINTTGNICIYKKEITSEKIKIDGNINTNVIYDADSAQERVRGINLNLNFSEIINVPNCTEEMILNMSTELENIECNVINGRKINVKARIIVKIKIYSNENLEIVNDIQNNNDIQALRKTMKINSLVGNGSTKAYVKDTITIDSNDNLAEILQVNINMIDKDIKTSYNKILAKTEAEIKILYLTEDNRIGTCINKIPIVGFIDMQNVAEDNVCDSNFEIRNMIIKPQNGDEHAIYIELEVEVSCMAYETKELNILEDLYSPVCTLNCTKNEITAIADKETKEDICSIRETVNIQEISEEELLDTYSIPKITNVNKLNSKIMYEGELVVYFLIGTPKTQVSNITRTIPFEFTIDNVENANQIDVNTKLEVSKLNSTVKSGGDIEIEVDIIFNTDMNRNISMSVISNIEETESRSIEDYSLIIYIVKSGDTLWKIAKKYNSTVDDIIRANGIENKDLIHPGEKIYVPKYYNRGIKEQEKSPTMMYA